MEESKYNLVMTFKTTAGSNANITIQDVDPNIDSDEVGELMDVIIAQNVFITKSGEFKSKVSAKKVETQQQVFEIN